MGERKNRERLNWKTLKRLGNYLAAERWYLGLAVGLAVAGNLLALAGPMPAATRWTPSALDRAGWILTGCSTMRNG